MSDLNSMNNANNINNNHNQFMNFLFHLLKSNPNFGDMNKINNQFLKFIFSFLKSNPNFMENKINYNINNLIEMNSKNNPMIEMNMMDINNNFNNNIEIISKIIQSNNNNSDKKLNQNIKNELIILINASKNINDEQYDVITQICSNVINEEDIIKNDIANYCSEKIKKKLKGEWFVLIQNINDNNFDFGFSKIKFKNFLIFQYREKIIYITPLNKTKIIEE